MRKHYGPQVRDEVVSDLIRETFAEALRQEKLQPAGGPRIEPVEVRRTGRPALYRDFRGATFGIKRAVGRADFESDDRIAEAAI